MSIGSEITNIIGPRGQWFFSFYSFGGIFVLVLTFLYVNVVRLMTTLSESVKVKKRSFCNVSSAVLQYKKKQFTLKLSAEWNGSVSEIPA